MNPDVIHRTPTACFGRVFLAALISALLIGAGRADDFSDGNAAYASGDFARAKQAYERAVADGKWSAALFHNLGSAEYRLGSPGRAALNYERSLALDPRSRETRNELGRLREQTGARTALPPIWERALRKVRPGTWALAAAALGWAGVCLAIPARRRPLLWLPASVAILGAAGAGWAAWHLDGERALAVIVDKESVVRREPAERGMIIETLPAGARVQLIQQTGEWTCVALADGTRAWLASTSVERVHLAP